jgi:hypothetical protein
MGWISLAAFIFCWLGRSKKVSFIHLVCRCCPCHPRQGVFIIWLCKQSFFTSSQLIFPESSKVEAARLPTGGEAKVDPRRNSVGWGLISWNLIIIFVFLLLSYGTFSKCSLLKNKQSNSKTQTLNEVGENKAC